jgi:hypothetical protein
VSSDDRSNLVSFAQLRAGELLKRTRTALAAIRAGLARGPRIPGLNNEPMEAELQEIEVSIIAATQDSGDGCAPKSSTIEEVVNHESRKTSG